jgi:hypothetical protein
MPLPGIKEDDMPRSTFSLPITTLFVVVVVSLLFVSVGQATRTAAQGGDKSLDIERYPGEPLFLVDLKVGGQPLKSKVVSKSRRNGEGLDTVKFKENNGWYRRIRATVRNVSGRPIQGLRAYLYFKSTTTGSMFSLPLARYRLKKGGPLQPGEELDLLVDDRVWQPTAELFSRSGESPDLSTVTLSVEHVTFSKDLQWHRGHLLRPDPADPNTWKVVEPEPRPASAEVWRPARFTQAAVVPSLLRTRMKFMSAAFTLEPAPEPPRRQTTICETYGGFIGDHCAQTDCYTKRELGSGHDGTKSSVPVSGTCEELNFPQVDSPSINCTNSTTHIRLQEDTSCPAPTPTPYGGCNQPPHPSTGQCNTGFVLYNDGVCGRSIQFIGRCNTLGDGYDEETCNCLGCGSCGGSPVLVDVRGDGFRMTDAAGGVQFDLDSDGLPEGWSWTAANTDDAWLALDRDGNGRIESGQELFGDYTAQPPSSARNGFAALAVFDAAAEGGNGDGIIDAADAVFPLLRLWQDTNHNGVSEPQELHTLQSLGLTRLHLDYKESRRVDAQGNSFRYRAKVDDARGSKVNRWAWDVFLVRN